MKTIHILTLATFGLVGCELMNQPVAPAPPPPALTVPKFDYNPPEVESKDSNKIVLILLKPFYVAERNFDRSTTSDHTMSYLALNGFQDFKNKMGIDFEEALTARGYFIKGPYGTEDEIVYSDKKNSDLLVSVEIDLKIDDSNVKAYYTNKTIYSYPQSYNVTYWNFNGTLVLDGKINIVVRAVTKTGFGDKLSVRSVPVARKEIIIDSYGKKYQNKDMFSIMKNDPGIYNPIMQELEDYYHTIFNKAWNFLDPQEFKEYKRLSEEIRGK